MSIIETIAAAVKPWNELYSKSKGISGTITFVHLGSLLIGGGLAIASDRAALRMRRADADERRRALREFSTVHRPVVTALGCMAASGVAMVLADVENFLVSPLYWTKMGLVVVLLTNGYLVMRTEQRLNVDPAPSNPLWRRLTLGAVTSIMLWLTTTLLGVFLMSS